ncbi:MAG: MFS transporter, partial [Terriglobales bacterium]
FLTDPVWWFLLFWLPKYLTQKQHLAFLAIGLPLVVIYNAASVGSIFGGWLPARLQALGWTLNRARKAAMLVCALAVVPIFAVVDLHNVWAAIGLLSLAAAAHQGWSANLFTLTSDLFPRQAVASVVGIGGFAGAVGGMLVAGFTGWLLQRTGSYVPIFTLAAGAYVVSWVIIHSLTPRLEPAHFPELA